MAHLGVGAGREPLLLKQECVDALAEPWTQMWNRERPAATVVAPACQVHFGRTPQSDRPTETANAAELQAVINTIGEAVPGIRYSHPSPPLVASDGSETFTLIWDLEVPSGARRTGIDVLCHRDGRFTEV